MKKTIFAVFTAFSLLAASCGDEKPAAKSIYQKCVDYYKKQADCLLTMQQGASSDCIFPLEDADFLNSLPPEKIEEIKIKTKDLASETVQDTHRCASRAIEDDRIECYKNISLSLNAKTEKKVCDEFK